MNLFWSAPILILLCVATPTIHRVNGSAEFGAVTDSLQDDLLELYLQEWNPDPPSTSDPVLTNASARLQICRDITHSGAFETYGKFPIKLTEALAKLDDLGDYNDGYRLEPVNLMFPPDQPDDEEPIIKTRPEYTFTCLLEEHSEEDDDYIEIADVRVSKVYNIEKGLHAHRFVFHIIDGWLDVMLAERSAQLYRRPGFNIELHYLELRKRHTPALGCHLDPVCRLALGSSEDGGNRVVRLCAIMLSSSYFRYWFEYPYRVHQGNWKRTRISFRTAEGQRAAQGRQYFEWMIKCSTDTTRTDQFHLLHISRAYNPYHVFVYEKTKTRRMRTYKFYLRHLSVNVGIVHERYNLGQVEV